MKDEHFSSFILHHSSLLRLYKNRYQPCTLFAVTKWNYFLGSCAVIITVCFMLPRAFGLMSFSQWGGMYTDGWCSVNAYPSMQRSITEAGNSQLPFERLLDGDPTIWRLVWFPPMHTAETCMAWAHSFCAHHTPSGKLVLSAFPAYRGQFLAQGLNICLFPKDPSFQWFTRP